MVLENTFLNKRKIILLKKSINKFDSDNESIVRHSPSLGSQLIE